jgi:hypothetical protein
MVNRLWKRLMGAGFVEPVQDWEGHDASHPELLDWLANELLTANYDVRHIIRLIVTSQAYQREAGLENLASAGPEERFFHAPARRRLTAEQIVDSLHAAAGAAIDSEPMTFIHDGSKTCKTARISGFRVVPGCSPASTTNATAPASPCRGRRPCERAGGLRMERCPPKTDLLRESESNVLQPGILENGILTQSLSRASGSRNWPIWRGSQITGSLAGAVVSPFSQPQCRNPPSGTRSCRICGQALKHDSHPRMKSRSPRSAQTAPSRDLAQPRHTRRQHHPARDRKPSAKRPQPRSAFATGMARNL